MSGNIALSATEFSVLETDGLISISIIRTGDLSLPTTIEYATTVGGTEFDNASTDDVQTGTRFVTIPSGADKAVIDIVVFDDDLDEGTESFSLSIIGASSGTLLFPRTARIDILDDERPEVVVAEPPLASRFNVTETAVFSGLAQPIAFEFSPTDPSLMYVAEKGGTVGLFDLDTGAKVSTALDISSRVNNVADRGLMDIALHPDLENNPYLYVFYVVDPADTAGRSGNAGPDGGGNRFSYLERFTLDEATGFQTVVQGSNVVLLGAGGQSLADISGNGALDYTSSQFVSERDSEIDPATGTFRQDYLKVDSLSHAGGSIEFGPDGALYVSTGDGTSYNTTDPRSVSVQNVQSLAGKILRIDPLTGQGLTDNPFFEQASGDVNSNAAKVYQTGLRNPFSMGFDDDGQLFVTNTGWTNYESVFTGGPGANFGWPFFEGGANGQLLIAPGGYSTLPGAQEFYQAVENGEIVVSAPYQSFSHRDADPGFQLQAITGADSVIASNKLPEALQGHYIFTDVVQGEVFSVSSDDRRDVQFLYRSDAGFAPVHFKQGPDGELYYANLVSGVVGRVSIEDPSENLGGAFGFGGSKYTVVNGILSRAEALAAAEEAGGTLLRIESQAEQDFIMETFWQGRGIYLDASDAAREGDWRNSDGDAIVFANWIGGGPDNGGGRGEGQDYAVIGSADGGWDDQGENQADVFNGSFWQASVPMVIVETPADEISFNGSRYIRLEDGLTRDEAAAQAALVGGNLLVVDSQAEQDFIMETFWNDQAIYLDIDDSGTEGTFVSPDGTLSYTNWGNGAPDNAGGLGGGQDYAVISTATGLWDDQSFDGADILASDGTWQPTQAVSIVEIGEPQPLTFGGKRYVALDDGLTRAEAAVQAAELGGSLLVIDSQAEQDFVMANFWKSQAIYLNINDAQIEGQFVSPDGALTYTNWFGGRPDNGGGGGQDYALIGTASGLWDDQSIGGSSVLGPDGRWRSTEAVNIVEIGEAVQPEPAENTFGNSSYQLLDSGFNRDQALAFAQATGGTLLRIESKAEQDYILETFWDNRAIYLDASDELQEGVWVNSDGEQISYADWFGAGPDNGGGFGQDFAVIGAESGLWDDQGRNQADSFNGLSWQATAGMAIIEYDLF